MKNFKKYLTKKNANTAAIAMAALSVLYVLIFFARRCFDLSKSMKYNLYFCIPLFCMIFATVYVTRLFVKNQEYSYSRLYVVLALCWGIAMQFIMPPISGSDEPNHVYSAFAAASEFAGRKAGGYAEDGSWIAGETYFWLREDESNGIAAVDLTFPGQYEVIANGGWFKAVGNDYVQCHYMPNELVRYVFPSIGIMIARVLGLGFSGTIMLGRLMNTLLFVLIGWFCVKIQPIGKIQTIIFSLFPATLNLCNSYSYDVLSIMFSLLLFSLCLHYSKPKVKLHIWDFIILMMVLVMLAPNKTVYLCFGIWLFAIPIKKWWRIITSKKWYEYLGLGVIIAAIPVAFVKVFWKFIFIALRNTVWKDGSTGIEQDATRASFEFDDLFEKFSEIAKMTIDGIKYDFWYNFRCVVGKDLGLVKLNAPVPAICTYIFMVLVALSYILIKGNKLKKRQLIVMFAGSIVCLAGIFFGCLFRFTPTDSVRVQVSWRYLVPVYMSLVMMFGNDAKENKTALALLHVENIALIFTMCNVLGYLFTR